MEEKDKDQIIEALEKQNKALLSILDDNKLLNECQQKYFERVLNWTRVLNECDKERAVYRRKIEALEAELKEMADENQQLKGLIGKRDTKRNGLFNL